MLLTLNADLGRGPRRGPTHARAYPARMHQQDADPPRLEFQGKAVHRRIEGRLAGAVSVVPRRVDVGDAAHIGADRQH